MLLSFRCENCYSFAKNANISLVASNVDEKRFAIERGNINVLPVISIYGANASGKSNYIKALSSMFWNICRGDIYLRGDVFAFDDNLADEPMLCEMIFCLPNENGETEYKEYKYGYKISREEERSLSDKDYKVIAEEWLESRIMESGDDFTVVFKRVGNRIDFGENVPDAVAALKATIGKSKSMLFLPLAGRTWEEPYSSIHDWCEETTPPQFFDDEDMRSRISSLARLVARNDKARKRYLKFMQKFDPCIVDIVSKPDKSTVEGYELYVKHKAHTPKDPKKQMREISIFEESAGTQKIASICSIILRALNHGGLVIADELDTKLHPKILREIVKSFQKQKANKAQLIFTAHNLVALNDQDMRTDEVYFVEKNDDGYSRIAKLPASVNKSKVDREFGKAYLAGRFGAIQNNFSIGEQNDI
ncbi:MAG: ATP-binding protein [Defluviitaleaceae bacterium]|nr:ATP-binding protein [Defluviitaleaceae bacterium]